MLTKIFGIFLPHLNDGFDRGFCVRLSATSFPLEDLSNIYGSSFFHYFALWCTVKALKPKVIIESGINQGIGSYFLRQAAGRHVKMIFISPDDPADYKDTYKSSIYFTRDNFADFSKIPWLEVLPQSAMREDSLIFFDDHQSGVRRTQEARLLGFRHIVFDDNYLPTVGDNFSPKMVCRASIYDLLNAKMEFIDDFGRMKRDMSIAEFFEEQRKFDHAVDIYAEFPPLWRGPTRWGIDPVKYEELTLSPIFDAKDVSFLPLDFDAEAKRYTHILYIKVSSSAKALNH